MNLICVVTDIHSILKLNKLDWDIVVLLFATYLPIIELWYNRLANNLIEDSDLRRRILTTGLIPEPAARVRKILKKN